jgi:hypothetical protein
VKVYRVKVKVRGKDGSVIGYKDGKKWGIDYSVGSGPNRRRFQKVIGTQQETVRALARVQEDILYGRYQLNPKLQKILFRQFA